MLVTNNVGSCSMFAELYILLKIGVESLADSFLKLTNEDTT